MTVETSDYILNVETLDAISEEIGGWLETLGYPRKEAVRLRLTMEELLLRIMEHRETAQRIQLSRQKRFGRRKACRGDV